MAYAPRLNRGTPKWPDSRLRVSIFSGRQRKLQPRTVPKPFSISSLRSIGGGCLLLSARVWSHPDARAWFEHFHISRQGCYCSDKGTHIYMDAGFTFKYSFASKISMTPRVGWWPKSSRTSLKACVVSHCSLFSGGQRTNLPTECFPMPMTADPVEGPRPTAAFVEGRHGTSIWWSSIQYLSQQWIYSEDIK